MATTTIDRGVTIHEARRILGCGKTKFYDLLADGEFPNAYKCGASTLIPESDLMNYRERNRVKSSDEGR